MEPTNQESRKKRYMGIPRTRPWTLDVIMEEPIGTEEEKLNSDNNNSNNQKHVDTNNNITMETESKTETEAAKEEIAETTVVIKDEVDSSDGTEEYTASNEGDQHESVESDLPVRSPVVTQQIPGRIPLYSYF